LFDLIGIPNGGKTTLSQKPTPTVIARLR